MIKEQRDKPKRGRPILENPKSPRAAYMRELMRKRRAADKLSHPKPTK